MKSNEQLNASIFTSLCSAKMKSEILVFFFLHFCSRQIDFTSILLFLHTHTYTNKHFRKSVWFKVVPTFFWFADERKRVQYQQSLQQRLSVVKFPPIFNEFSIVCNMLKAKAWCCDAALHQLWFYQHDFVNVIVCYVIVFTFLSSTDFLHIGFHHSPHTVSSILLFDLLI